MPFDAVIVAVKQSYFLELSPYAAHRPALRLPLFIRLSAGNVGRALEDLKRCGVE